MPNTRSERAQSAAVYRFLSRLFRAEANAALLEKLRAVRFPESAEGASGAAAEWLAAGARFNRAVAALPRDAEETLAVDFARAFLGAGLASGEAAFPYASVYTSEKRSVMQEAFSRMHELLENRGLAVPAGNAALLADHEDAGSEKDFGKNIIPTLLGQKRALYAYVFSGYWKDVGTIPSYYSTQMELLDPKAEFRLMDTRMHILSNLNEAPSSFIGEDAEVSHSMVCNGCEIYGTVVNSILSPGVTVEKGAVVRDSILLPDSTVGEGAVVEKTILNERSAIAPGAKFGGRNVITVVGDGSTMEVEA